MPGGNPHIFCVRPCLRQIFNCSALLFSEVHIEYTTDIVHVTKRAPWNLLDREFGGLTSPRFRFYSWISFMENLLSSKPASLLSILRYSGWHRFVSLGLYYFARSKTMTSSARQKGLKRKLPIKRIASESVKKIVRGTLAIAIDNGADVCCNPSRQEYIRILATRALDQWC